MQTSCVDTRTWKGHVPGRCICRMFFLVHCKVPPGTLRKDMCTDTQMHMFSGYSRIGVLKMNGHTLNVVRKYFL